MELRIHSLYSIGDKKQGRPLSFSWQPNTRCTPFEQINDLQLGSFLEKLGAQSFTVELGPSNGGR